MGLHLFFLAARFFQRRNGVKAAVIPLFDTTEARGALLSRRIGSARRQWWLTHLVARA